MQLLQHERNLFPSFAGKTPKILELLAGILQIKRPQISGGLLAISFFCFPFFAQLGSRTGQSECQGVC